MIRLIGKYFLNILRAIDELGNTLAGGSPHETISSRLGRNWRGTPIEKAVDKAAEIIAHEKDHCESAAEKEMNHPAAGLDEILARMKENKEVA
jgi:hypothetical protein